MNHTDILGITAALITAASWALGGVLFQQLGESLSSLAMTLIKGFLSIVLLGVVWVITGPYAIAIKPLLILIGTGVLGIAVADTCFFEALRHLGARSLILLQTLGQLLTPLFAVFYLGESRKWDDWVGIALISGGVALVLGVDLAKDKRVSQFKGIVLGIVSVVCMSVAYVIQKPALEKVSALQATLIQMVAGTLGMLILGLATRQLTSWVTPLKDRQLARKFFIAVCVVTFGGFWMSRVAWKHLDVSLASPLMSTEPLFVIPLAALLLKERITPRAVVGSLAAVMGIALLCYDIPGK